MNVDIFASAVVGHLVGDYLLQNDWMAINKKKAFWPCAIHCAVWMNCVTLFMWFGGLELTWPKSQIVGAILFWTHFIQDRTNIISWWMRLKWKDQSKFMETDRLFIGTHEYDATIIPGLGPWSIIVVDNVWHIVTLFAVCKFL